MSTTRLSLQHARAYRALMLEAYERQQDTPASTVQERANLPLIWWEQHVTPEHNAMIYGAFVDDQLVGATNISFETQGKGQHKASLFGMYVTPSHRQKGLGRQLVQALVEEARKHKGVMQMHLSVATGHTPAQHLYRTCGFDVVSIEPSMLRGAKLASKTHMSRNIRH